MSRIPEPVKMILKPFYELLKLIYYRILDFVDIIKGSKNPLIPPRSMIFIGDGDYVKTGIEFLEYFKEYGKLKPDNKILDVGCGIGRMAIPLTAYMSEEGEYFGFDIVKKGVDWATSNITSRYPNFHFQHSDIYNKMYNPTGKVNSSEYIFNYKNEMFDFVFLTSVFTHMYTNDVQNYLSEISRVMKSGATCLITFFLLNEISSQLIRTNKSTQNLIHLMDEYSMTKDKNIPENAIGFDENYIINLFESNGLKILDPIHYGSWCGRSNFKSYQDIVIAQKYQSL